MGSAPVVIPPWEEMSEDDAAHREDFFIPLSHIPKEDITARGLAYQRGLFLRSERLGARMPIAFPIVVENGEPLMPLQVFDVTIPFITFLLFSFFCACLFVCEHNFPLFLPPPHTHTHTH